MNARRGGALFAFVTAAALTVLAQSVNASQDSLVLGSTFSISATARPGRTLEELEAAIDEELALLRKEGPTPAEVDRVRNVFETRVVSGLHRAPLCAAIPPAQRAHPRPWCAREARALPK
jgi:predicted Zn-dependent peptidase